MNPQVYVLVAGGALLALFVRRYLAGCELRKVRGPPSPSWLVGHNEEFDHQLEVGDIESKWFAEYGAVWRTKGCMGEDVLSIADPKALQYIFHKSGYHFPKPPVARQYSREITGPGILFAQGAWFYHPMPLTVERIADVAGRVDRDHARMRKIMNPAFTAGQLRSFLPLFRASAQKLGQKWQDLLQNELASKSGARIDVLEWLARCTLDIIGEVGFDVQCGALEDSLNPVVEAYKNMFADALLYSSRATILFRWLWYWIPMPLLQFVQYIPTKDHTRFRQTLKVINKFARSLIREKTEAALAGENEKKKDIMSILVKANASEDPKSRLTDGEMVSMMSTFFLAGHETTGSSMAWMLYEVSRHPLYQSKMREEIKAIRARVTERGDTDFSVSDLDQMTYCLAAIKEVLRLHPIVYTLTRHASRDDVLPLANPITLSTGALVTEVPVPKGTDCRISIWLYNRLPEIWGLDANEFNPHRFIEHENIGSTYVGVTSNLMSFSAGLQACIGWRFSIIEMQAILVELIEHFEFAIPDDKPEIIPLAAGLVAPLVKNEMSAGPQMPICVSLAQ